MMLDAGLTGFFTSLSLIVAIGSQNAFVLRQGLTRKHIFPLVLFCSLSDALLIVAGVLGFSAMTAQFPNLPGIMTWAGALFLVMYAVQRFWNAWKNTYQFDVGKQATHGGQTLMLAAAFTWLNPHVYLDTLMLIGAVATDFDFGGPRFSFALGAIMASFIFFFSLGYGASLLAPIMQSSKSWQVLDVLIGGIMLLLAAKLLGLL